MQYKEYRTIDKSGWGNGPWQNEPDKVQFITCNGFPALIVRNGMGALCGYVGVNSDHPWFEKDYDSVDPYPSVHGGLTFADKCDTNPEAETHGICHLVENGEDDNIWWLGFDCSHLGDLNPKYEYHSIRSHVGETYKNIDYVKAEIEQLAAQAQEAMANN